MSDNLPKKIYFASDFHLGAPNQQESLKREKTVVDWLNDIAETASTVYLVGDIFDFWFEYKTVVPKGFLRLFSALLNLSDRGVKLIILTGNHDLWMRDYLQKEIGCEVYHHPINAVHFGKKFHIAHGDGLGPGDEGYKRLKKLFTNSLAQRLFRWVHPDIGIGLANFFSRKSRNATGMNDARYLGDEKEFLIQYAKDLLQNQSFDFLVFGHRHLPMMRQFGSAQFINLGDWITYFTYTEFDGQEMNLKQYPFPNQQPIPVI